MRTVARHDTAISMDSTNNGTALCIDSMDGFSISLTVTRATGTLAGTLKLQGTASNPWTDNVNNTANSAAIWDDIAGSSMAVSTGSTATYSYNSSTAYYRGVRIVWTSSSGTGAYTGDWFAKGPSS